MHVIYDGLDHWNRGKGEGWGAEAPQLRATISQECDIACTGIVHAVCGILSTYIHVTIDLHKRNNIANVNGDRGATVSVGQTVS